MGIRHLQKFMTENVTNGYVQVSIVDECQKFQSSNNGQKPIIVVDLMSVVSILNRSKLDLLYGGRSAKYFKIIDGLFRKLSEVAELVFFEDGLVKDEKYDTWIDRQDQKYEKSLAIIDLVDHGVSLKEIVDRSGSYEIQSVTTHLELIEERAKTYGKVIVTITKECDAELAQFATNNPAVLAVLADDTDFLIFPGTWRYFSTSQINEQTLTTMEFNRIALRSFLNLTDQQLIILATIGGNDIIKYDEVRRCHQRNFGHNAAEKFPAIAQILREQINNDNMIQFNLADFLLDNTSPHSISRIQDSLAQYDITFDLVDHTEGSPLLNFCRINDFNFVYGILQQMPKNLTLAYYDLRPGSNWPDFYQSSLRLFQRQAGIILKDQRPRSGQIRLEIYAKRSSHEGHHQHFVPLVYPTINVPPLIQLLDRENFQQLDPIRYSLLKWMISDSLTVHLTEIPENYVRNALTLFYLVREGFVDVFEADLILLTIKNVVLNIVDEELEYPPIVDSRAFRIAFLFAKMHSSIGRSIKTVGLKNLKHCLNFDGVVFHKTYLYFKASGVDPVPLLKDIEKCRIYK